MAFQLLFADDSATMHRVVQITLAREDGYVTAVNSGRDAVLKARELQPHIAILDVNMPEMDGYSACQAIKDDPTTGHIPVLLLASNQEPLDVARAQDCGADGHMLKPFDTQTFIDTLKQTLAKAGAARPAPAVQARAQVEPQRQHSTPPAEEVTWDAPRQQPARPVAAASPAVAPPASQPFAQQVAPAGHQPAPRTTPQPQAQHHPHAHAQAQQQPSRDAAATLGFAHAITPAAGLAIERPTPQLRASTTPFAGTTTPAAAPHLRGPSSGPATTLPAGTAPRPPAAVAAPAAARTAAPAMAPIAAPTPWKVGVEGRAPGGAHPMAAPAAAHAPTLPRGAMPAGPMASVGSPAAVARPTPAATSATVAARVAAAVAPAAVQATGRVMPAAGGLDAKELLAAAREILERVAWEVVPPMAEALIKEHIERLAKR